MRAGDLGEYLSRRPSNVVDLTELLRQNLAAKKRGAKASAKHWPSTQQRQSKRWPPSRRPAKRQPDFSSQGTVNQVTRTIFVKTPVQHRCARQVAQRAAVGATPPRQGTD